MTLKLAQFCDDPPPSPPPPATKKKYPQNLHTPKNIHFSENPPKIEIQNLDQKNGPSLRMCENIRVPPPLWERTTQCELG